MSPLCPNCSKFVSSDTQKSITCDGCQKQIHLACVQLTRDDVNRITRTASRSIKVFCAKCIIDQDSISTLKSLILGLQAELLEIKEKLNSQKSSMPNNDLETIIEEVNERRRREQNVVISGVPEMDDKSSKTMVSNIVAKVAPEVNMDNAFITRIGKHAAITTAARPRLVKIKFHKPEDARLLLKNAKKVRMFDEFKGIYINNDRTPLQMQHFKCLKSELEERKANGEPDLRIIYSNGVPRISSASKN